MDIKDAIVEKTLYYTLSGFLVMFCGDQLIITPATKNTRKHMEQLPPEAAQTLYQFVLEDEKRIEAVVKGTKNCKIPLPDEDHDLANVKSWEGPIETPKQGNLFLRQQLLPNIERTKQWVQPVFLGQNHQEYFKLYSQTPVEVPADEWFYLGHS